MDDPLTVLDCLLRVPHFRTQLASVQWVDAPVLNFDDDDAIFNDAVEFLYDWLNLSSRTTRHKRLARSKRRSRYNRGKLGMRPRKRFGR